MQRHNGMSFTKIQSFIIHTFGNLKLSFETRNSFGNYGIIRRHAVKMQGATKPFQE